MANRYLVTTGMSEADLAAFVVSQRQFARLNPRAIMREPLTVEDYLAAPYLCEPLRLFDYCLVNDGGVALVVTTADRARSLPNVPVLVRGIGRCDMARESTSLRPRLADFYHPAHRRAAEQVYSMAGLAPEDIDAVQIYDSFSIHIPVALEGFGFCAPGDAAALARDGGTGPGGKLPVNTCGGHLSGSYMQGWGHQAEAIRQLRHTADDRQVDGARAVQYLSDVAGMATSIIYARSGS
jgi:acetyl-CoA acetyltransferase